MDCPMALALLFVLAWFSMLLPTTDAAGYRAERILIQPKVDTTPSSLETFHGSKGGRRLRAFQRLSGIQVIEVPRGILASDLIETYRHSGLVLAVESDFFIEPTATPSDPN